VLFPRTYRHHDLGLLIARLGFGLSFLYFHGWAKLTAGPRGWARTGETMSNLGVPGGYEFFGLMAGVAEGIGGLLFAIGLLFRPAAIGLMCVMAVATIEQYSRPMPAPEHAIKNFFIFLGFFFAGPGRYALDAMVRRK